MCRVFKKAQKVFRHKCAQFAKVMFLVGKDCSVRRRSSVFNSSILISSFALTSAFVFPYTDATKAKDLLLQFQTYVKTISQRGPTDLTLYSENLAAKLLQIYYDYPFVNMNYAAKNIAGIDLLNKENNHGIQITVQDNSSEKVIKSIKKSKSYNKLYESPSRRKVS